MSSPYYDLYVQGVMALARSLVIKSEATAEAINRGLEELGHRVDPVRPETWKYYLNLAGEYHYTDTPIFVNSMDTLEPIEFTKQNLQLHRATANGYALGGEYFNELVRKYPHQEMLIRGIIKPVNINEAIKARDGQILFYDSTLVESNESNLIPKLQRWIEGFLTRWHIEAYGIVDDLYVPAMLGVLYVNLPLVIMNIRLENCRTNYVHSFHIREYLASNGRLDVFMDFLTKKQALFLYRNIRYIHRNAGKRHIFNLLVEKIFTDRGMPLASYEMRHNLAQMPENLYPEIEMALSFLNFDVGQDFRDNKTVGEILDKEVEIAEGNFEENEEAFHYIPESMQIGDIDRVPTKVLESIVSDTSEINTKSFADLILYHWLYLSTHDRYTAIIPITHPKDGQQINLSAKDAFALFIYAYNRSIGIELPTVPALVGSWIKRPMGPTFEELRAAADPRYVSDAMIEFLLSDHPPMGVYISVEAFRDYCHDLQTMETRNKVFYQLEEHMTIRGQLEGLVYHLYHFPLCELGNGESYNQWFEDRGIDLNDLTELDFGIMAAEILEGATGNNLGKSLSLKDLQSAMVRLMTQLSSYSIHILETLTSSTFRRAEWATIRPGDSLATGFVDVKTHNSFTTALDMDVEGGDRINSRLGNFNIYKKAILNYRNRAFLDVGLDLDIREITKAKIRFNTTAVRLLKFTATEITE